MSNTISEMTTFTATGFRSVEAETMKEAAEIFAGRQARKDYGKSGYVRLCNAESWSQDGSFCEYNVFIGYTPAGQHNRGTTSGRNFRFTVYRA